MPEKIIVGPINSGLKTNREPFYIDNDSFPILENAYQWRGRIKRKRGTTSINRLKIPVSSSSLGNTDGSGALSVNLITLFSLVSTASIVLGSITVTIGAQSFTDSSDGTLTNGGAGTGTINYATGALTIQTNPVLATTAATITFAYYPSLPVMGLRDYISSSSAFPLLLGFDTTYAYNINTTSPFTAFNVSYYKNLATGTYTGYTQKSTWTALNWNGQDYQQMRSCNFANAFWCANGVTVPFSTTNIGMQYKAISNVAITAAGPPAQATLTITGHGLVVGDFVFINEVAGTTGINMQTGFVITVTDANTVVVQFPLATIATAGTGGIAQYLTNSSDTTKDCIRFYDGAPVSSATPPAFSTNKGWINYCPPLSLDGVTSVGGLTPDRYYLVGAKLIVPFKDRLLFIGPVVQTSAAGSQKYLPDTVLYSQNGTPYYTASFAYAAATSYPTASELISKTYTYMNVPTNETAIPNAFFTDIDGYAGDITSGFEDTITSVNSNEDVLILGFETKRQSRFIYTGSELIPFAFYTINSEYGSFNDFSSINFDRGVISIGPNGIIQVSQTEVARLDIPIPDTIFQISLNNHGSERITAQRDYINEWIYFTYSSSNLNQNTYFPNQTLFYNYRDGSWALFNETYTTYGTLRQTSGKTWDDLTDFTWDEWNDPWDAGENDIFQPEVIGGNSEGFILMLAEGTGEAPSLAITSFSGSTLTVTNHCLNINDYVMITDCLGTIAQYVNGRVFKVSGITTNTFDLNDLTGTGTYLGGGQITRLYVPNIQTKQFPAAWGLSRKTRIGVQQYLLSTTSFGKINLLIFLSQNSANAYNTGNIFPANNTVNSALIYTDVISTAPETNNLQMLTASSQAQIWHRMNTSLIGDTIQLGFTLGNTLMEEFTEIGSSVAITNITKANPCVITCANNFAANQMVKIQDVTGMTEVNGNIYQVTSATTTTVTLSLDSSAFSAYVSGGTIIEVASINPTSEIELHGFILDVYPSQLLS